METPKSGLNMVHFWMSQQTAHPTWDSCGRCSTLFPEPAKTERGLKGWNELPLLTLWWSCYWIWTYCVYSCIMLIMVLWVMLPSLPERSVLACREDVDSHCQSDLEAAAAIFSGAGIASSQSCTTSDQGQHGSATPLVGAAGCSYSGTVRSQRLAGQIRMAFTSWPSWSNHLGCFPPHGKPCCVLRRWSILGCWISGQCGWCVARCAAVALLLLGLLHGFWGRNFRNDISPLNYPYLVGGFKHVMFLESLPFPGLILCYSRWFHGQGLILPNFRR